MVSDQLADRLARFVTTNTRTASDAPDRMLWAARRTINAALLAALHADRAPRSTWLIIIGHAVALAGRPEHRTHLAVLGHRCGVTAKTMGGTTHWLVEHRYLTRSMNRFGRGRRWLEANDEGAAFAAYGVISSHLLAVIAAQPDRAVLARTALGAAVLLGRLDQRRLPANLVAAATGEPEGKARGRLARLRELDLLILDDDRRTAFGPQWISP